MASDIEEFKARLEEWSEDHIRYLLATRKIRKPEKVALANAHILRKDQEREDKLERRKEASVSEQMQIAHSAKNAAWASAAAAKSANRIAKVALVVAIVAIGVSIVGWPFD